MEVLEAWKTASRLQKKLKIKLNSTVAEPPGTFAPHTSKEIFEMSARLCSLQHLSWKSPSLEMNNLSSVVDREEEHVCNRSYLDHRAERNPLICKNVGDPWIY